MSDTTIDLHCPACQARICGARRTATGAWNVGPNRIMMCQECGEMTETAFDTGGTPHLTEASLIGLSRVQRDFGEFVQLLQAARVRRKIQQDHGDAE